MMSNSYLAADVTEIGKASDVILGESKGILFDDGPGQDKRTIVLEEFELNDEAGDANC
jgi:hypothetical protein